MKSRVLALGVVVGGVIAVACGQPGSTPISRAPAQPPAEEASEPAPGDAAEPGIQYYIYQDIKPGREPRTDFAPVAPAVGDKASYDIEIGSAIPGSTGPNMPKFMTVIFRLDLEVKTVQDRARVYTTRISNADIRFSAKVAPEVLRAMREHIVEQMEGKQGDIRVEVLADGFPAVVAASDEIAETGLPLMLFAGVPAQQELGDGASWRYAAEVGEDEEVQTLARLRRTGAVYIINETLSVAEETGVGRKTDSREGTLKRTMHIKPGSILPSRSDGEIFQVARTAEGRERRTLKFQIRQRPEPKSATPRSNR